VVSSNLSPLADKKEPETVALKSGVPRENQLYSKNESVKPVGYRSLVKSSTTLCTPTVSVKRSSKAVALRSSVSMEESQDAVPQEIKRVATISTGTGDTGKLRLTMSLDNSAPDSPLSCSPCASYAHHTNPIDSFSQGESENSLDEGESCHHFETARRSSTPGSISPPLSFKNREMVVTCACILELAVKQTRMALEKSECTL
jgi:hypothetical protein